MPTKTSRPRRVCIIGARGVGKSSLVKAALPRLDGWVHLIGSEILSSLLPEGQTMAALDPLQRRNYRHLAAAFMLKQDLAGKTGLLCEGHCALYSDRTGTAEEVFTEADDADAPWSGEFGGHGCFHASKMTPLWRPPMTLQGPLRTIRHPLRGNPSLLRLKAKMPP